jgi:hypothetical protein
MALRGGQQVWAYAGKVSARNSRWGVWLNLLCEDATAAPGTLSYLPGLDESARLFHVPVLGRVTRHFVWRALQAFPNAYAIGAASGDAASPSVGEARCAELAVRAIVSASRQSVL